MSRFGVSAAAAVGAAAAVYVNPGLVGDVPMLGEVISAVAAIADADADVGDGDGGPGKKKTEDDESSRGGGDDGGGGGVPARYRVLYKRAAAGSCVGWRVLAAIGYIESRHGANTGPSWAGALGPMQFMPETWRAYGRDGNGDGRADVHDPADAIPAAAGYLCAHGAATDLRTAIWHYNHSWSYVNQVLTVADRLR
jgi:membrane-bound lytic murein transglycosylase B